MATATSSPVSAGIKAAQDVASLLRARNSLLWIVSKEESRVKRAVFEAASAAGYDFRSWDCATGLAKFDGQQTGRQTDPGEALQVVRSNTARMVYAFCDLAYWLKDPTVLRSLRSLADSLGMAPREQARAIVVITPSSEIPPELADDAIVIDWPLPDRTEIGSLLDSAIAALPDDLQKTAAPNGTREAAVNAAMGLSEKEAGACYRKSLVASKTIDPQAVAQEKKRVIARASGLEWYDPLPDGLAAVGGLDELKRFCLARKSAFSAAARAYGLPAPKGVLLVGPPGTGKSLSAKAIATAFALPLLKLDLGAMKSKYVGDSEANIRKALKLVDTIGDCVLWLDEIEKAMQGGSGMGAADGGVSTDQLGVVLTWMQERKTRCFVVATANSVESLPEAILRKGRFDELFFCDLPNTVERAEILRAQLTANGRPVDCVDVPYLANGMAGYTGAEIAAVIVEAMYTAFSDNARQITTADVQKAREATVPLSKTAGEKIEALRKWASGRARNASSEMAVTAPSQSRELDV